MTNASTLPSGLRIVYRHLDPSPALSAAVAHEFTHLQQLSRTPLSCAVTIDRSDRFGMPACQVRLQLDVQGTPLIVDHAPDREEEADPYAEVREAFQIARRQLTKHFDAKAPRSGDRITDHLPRG